MTIMYEIIVVKVSPDSEGLPGEWGVYVCIHLARCRKFRIRCEMIIMCEIIVRVSPDSEGLPGEW